MLRQLPPRVAGTLGGRWAVVSRTGERRHALIEAARPARSAGRGTAARAWSGIASCGIRKQTLLYYFPTKDALLEACLRAAGERVTEETPSGLGGQGDVLGPGGSHPLGVPSGQEEWPEFPMLIRAGESARPRGVRSKTGDLEALQHRAVRFLQEGMDAGIRAADPTFLLFQLYRGRRLAHRGERARADDVVASTRAGLARRREREVVTFVRARSSRRRPRSESSSARLAR